MLGAPRGCCLLRAACCLQSVRDDQKVQQIHENAEVFDHKAETSFKYLQVGGGGGGGLVAAATAEAVVVAAAAAVLAALAAWLRAVAACRPCLLPPSLASSQCLSALRLKLLGMWHLHGAQVPEHTCAMWQPWTTPGSQCCTRKPRQPFAPVVMSCFRCIPINLSRPRPPLQVCTACANAFAHGSNEVANAVGPLAAIYQIWRDTSVSATAAVPTWLLAVGGVGIVLGALRPQPPPANAGHARLRTGSPHTRATQPLLDPSLITQGPLS